MDIEANVRHSGWTFHTREGVTSLSVREVALVEHPVARAWQAISAAVVVLPRNYRHRAFLTDWAVPLDGKDTGHGSVSKAARKHRIPHNSAARIVHRFLSERGLRLPKTGAGRPAKEHHEAA